MADRYPNLPGVYQLQLWLPRGVRIAVGKLGTFEFPRGTYLYTGSALGGLAARLARHLRSDKKLHWHIDYLLPHARIEHVRLRVTRQPLECAWNAAALRRPAARAIVRRFGSSDCRCPTHLVYLGPSRGEARSDSKSSRGRSRSRSPIPCNACRSSR